MFNWVFGNELKICLDTYGPLLYVCATLLLISITYRDKFDVEFWNNSPINFYILETGKNFPFARKYKLSFQFTDDIKIRTDAVFIDLFAN